MSRFDYNYGVVSMPQTSLTSVDPEYRKNFDSVAFNDRCENLNRLLTELKDTLNDVAYHVDVVDNDTKLAFALITRAEMLEETAKDIIHTQNEINNIINKR